MNKISIKTALIPLALLAFTGYTGMASAFSIAQSLGATVSPKPVAADLYRFNCGAGTVKLRLCVTGTAGVEAQIAREGTSPSAVAVPSASCTDPASPTAGSGGTSYTPVAPVPAVAGFPAVQYNVLVNSTSTTAKSYTLYFRCENASGVLTTTTHLPSTGTTPEINN